MLCVSEPIYNMELYSPDEGSDSIVLRRAIQDLCQQPGLDWTNLKVTPNFFSHDTTDDNKSSLHIYNAFLNTSHKLSPGLSEITYIDFRKSVNWSENSCHGLEP